METQISPQQSEPLRDQKDKNKVEEQLPYPQLEQVECHLLKKTKLGGCLLNLD